MQTRLLYAGANRMTAMKLATLDLPEGNAMRAPGEAPGLMALEIAIDEIAERNITLDSLAHCVGNIKLGALHRTSEVDFFDCISTNLFSAFFTLSGFIEYLKKSSTHGSAVFVSSAFAP